jgi:hypothetical protein
LYFQLPYLPEETCLQQAGSSAVEGTSQAVLGSSDQQKVLAGLSLFLKSEKIQLCSTYGKDLSTDLMETYFKPTKAFSSTYSFMLKSNKEDMSKANPLKTFH